MSATEAQIERAVTVLKRMIDAAENGDQASGHAVVAATAASDLLAVCRDMLPHNVCLTNKNVRDRHIVALDVPIGALRRIAAAIAKAEGRS
ncbi:MAG: hypothetical protein A4S12_06925 [Proteobacteria bacterium SG_bin5]|nr:hypothetical protein [Sphingomonas sp.]OQW42066.1 MAG: hypothetical protein A4S12_06925 [Proteobacteria bacterium SG_bin5]